MSRDPYTRRSRASAAQAVLCLRVEFRLPPREVEAAVARAVAVPGAWTPVGGAGSAFSVRRAGKWQIRVRRAEPETERR